MLSLEEWTTVRSTFAQAGPTGDATAQRSLVLRPDGAVELRPSAEDLFAKEVAFTRLPIVDAYSRAPDAKLLIAAERGPSPEQRRADIDRLCASTSLEVRWFPNGHWISAEDTPGVARVVGEFLARL